MQINEILAQSGGLRAMANELGISEADAARGAEVLAPAILGGFKKQAQAQPTGLEGLGGLLGQLGGGALLDNVLGAQPTDVAQGASARTGLDPAILKKMLPMLAMMIAGFMAQRGGAAGSPAPSSGGLGGLLGGLLGGGGSSGLGGLTSMLDMDKDGNPLDDLLRMAGRSS